MSDRNERRPDSPTIELWELGDSGDAFSTYVGLIVLAPTGIRWANQTGGVACTFPSAEGFFVPLRPRELRDPFEDDRGVPYNASDVGAWLVAVQLDAFLEPLAEDDPTAIEYGLREAWVPVRIKLGPGERGENPLLFDLAGRVAIVTYTNSD